MKYQIYSLTYTDGETFEYLTEDTGVVKQVRLNGGLWQAWSKNADKTIEEFWENISSYCDKKGLGYRFEMTKTLTIEAAFLEMV